MRINNVLNTLFFCCIVVQYIQCNSFNRYLKKSFAGLGLFFAGYVLYNEFRFFKTQDHWQVIKCEHDQYFNKIMENISCQIKSPVELKEELNLLKNLEVEMKERKKTALITRCLEALESYKKVSSKRRDKLSAYKTASL